MHHPPTQDRPALTHQKLLALREEIILARDELIEMVEIKGPIRTMWSKPRRYFAPESCTLIPFPSAYLWDLLEPVWCLNASTADDRTELVGEILTYAQFFELVRREIIPERFS
jgi:hypothetical protein